MTFFDAELHPLALRPGDLADVRFFGVAGALGFSDAPAGPPGRDQLRRGWEALVTAGVRRLRRATLEGVAAVGLHPRRIPLRGLEALLAELPEYLGRRHVVALGAIGLDEGGPREEMVFARQLDLARELRIPVVVQSPARGKERITRRIISLLREHEVDPARVLVTRADERTVRMIRACGYAAGLSLHTAPERGSDPLEAVVRLVRSLGPEGIVLGSGAGDGAGDLLAVPRAAARMTKAGLSAAVVRRVCGANARALLQVTAAGS